MEFQLWTFIIKGDKWWWHSSSWIIEESLSLWTRSDHWKWPCKGWGFVIDMLLNTCGGHHLWESPKIHCIWKWEQAWERWSLLRKLFPWRAHSLYQYKYIWERERSRLMTGFWLRLLSSLSSRTPAPQLPYILRREKDHWFYLLLPSNNQYSSIQ